MGSVSVKYRCINKVVKVKNLKRIRKKIILDYNSLIATPYNLMYCSKNITKQNSLTDTKKTTWQQRLKGVATHAD